jgi:hypothetical protein
MPADSNELLTLSLQIEDLARQVYEVLAGRFGGEAKLLFRRMADEECQHASRLKLLRSMRLNDSRSFLGLAGSPARLAALRDQASAILESVRAPGLSLDEARAAMWELEDGMIAAHAEVLADYDGTDPGIKVLFEFLSSQDRAHRGLLSASTARHEPAHYSG